MSIFDKDEELIKGILAQSDGAINYLYEQIGPKVKNYIVKAGGSDEEANDIFQEGIISVFINVRSGKYKPDGNTKFSSYLTQVCKYKWYDTLKSGHKKTSQNELVEVSSDENMQTVLETNEKYSALHEIIDSLDEQCKNILKQFYWEKKSIMEISKSLKMVAASVKNGKYRCMQKLKEKSKQLVQYI